MTVWLQAKVRERGLELRRSLNGGPVCDVQHCCGGIFNLRRYIKETYLYQSWRNGYAERGHGVWSVSNGVNYHTGFFFTTASSAMGSGSFGVGWGLTLVLEA